MFLQLDAFTSSFLLGIVYTLYGIWETAIWSKDQIYFYSKVCTYLTVWNQRFSLNSLEKFLVFKKSFQFYLNWTLEETSKHIV